MVGIVAISRIDFFYSRLDLEESILSKLYCYKWKTASGWRQFCQKNCRYSRRDWSPGHSANQEVNTKKEDKSTVMEKQHPKRTSQALQWKKFERIVT